MSNKRGISIVLSWVLAIGIVVGLSVSVYYFFAQQSLKSIDYSERIYLEAKVCNEVNLKILDACFQEDLNREDNSRLKVSILNEGSSEINGDFLLIQIVKNDRLIDVIPTLPNTNMGPFGQVTAEAFYHESPDEIRIIPRVIRGGAIFCANSIKGIGVERC